jgi:hypothetical protein
MQDSAPAFGNTQVIFPEYLHSMVFHSIAISMVVGKTIRQISNKGLAY